MPRKKRRIIAADCETDPFYPNRVPEPFVWGAWHDGEFDWWTDTDEFVSWLREQYAIVYMHNGGKFDFMFLLGYMDTPNYPTIINGRIVSMQLGNAEIRDSFAICPVKLSDFQKTDIDYTKMEPGERNKHWAEILEYLKDDCYQLYRLVSTFNEIAGRKHTVASNALASAKKMEIDPGRTNGKFDAYFRAFYYGGRCEAFDFGHFENVDFFDIKSAYPYAMMWQHPCGTDYRVGHRPEFYSDERLQACFVSVECTSHGAFPRQTKSGLEFPFTHDRFNVTGWEYAVARKHGLIENVRNVSIYEFYETIDFQDYVDAWFERKENADAEGDKAAKTVAKIMLNSLYGKMAQNPENYEDFAYVSRDDDLQQWYDDGGWRIYQNVPGTDIVILWRKSLDPKRKMAEEKGLAFDQLPIFYNIATGASITGFARAMLLDAINTVGTDKVLYTDTDSLAVMPGARTDLLRRDGALGSWEWEGRTKHFYLAGKKLYAAHMTEGPKLGEKIASKGAKLGYQQVRDMVVNNETVTWENEAPTFDIAGSARFMVRRIRPTAKGRNETANQRE